MQDGRAFIYTEETADKLNWADIPLGSIQINTKTGFLYGKLDPTNVVVMNDGTVLSPAMVNDLDNLVYIIKDNILATAADQETRLQGLKAAVHNKVVDGNLTSVQYTSDDVNTEINPQIDWVPLGVKNDGTLSIAKDTILKKEIFTIQNANYAPNEFTYTNEDGQIRHGIIGGNGEYIFTLEKGHYAPGRNMLSVLVNGVFPLHLYDNGLKEISEIRFAVNEPLENDTVIIADYASIFRIGNPYPRIFLGKDEPEDAEIGDFWLDFDASLEEDDFLGENIETKKTISWERITGKPNTIQGYNIIDNLSYVGHNHETGDVLNLQNYTRNIIAGENIQWNKVVGKPVLQGA